VSKTEITDAEKINLVREYARHTIGSEQIHRHPLGMLFTDGMMYVAETCGAHWLLDLVVSWQPEIKKKHGRLAYFQVWRLCAPEKDGAPWVIDAWSDTPEAPDSEDGPASVLLARQEIGYSDFPRNLCHIGVIDEGARGFQFWVENGTAMLKEER